MLRRGLFVTGTGTGVGKSVVAASIIAALVARGRRVAAFKPAVSGLDEPAPDWPADHELLAAATGWQPPQAVAPHLFGPAVSPHLAATKADVRITLEDLLEAYDDATEGADAVICEGVGGPLVPLCEEPDLSVLDLMLALELPAVVVTHPHLGTISDTRLTVDRLRGEGLTVVGVVISDWPDRPGAIERSNLETLQRLVAAEVVTLEHTTPDEIGLVGAALPADDWLAAAN